MLNGRRFDSWFGHVRISVVLSWSKGLQGSGIYVTERGKFGVGRESPGREGGGRKNTGKGGRG